MQPPVLLIYDLDPSWTAGEQAEAERESRRLGFAMRRRGHSVRFIPVDTPDLTSALSGHDPRDVLVFNWCESLPGIPHSEPLVAETLENLNFTYTGATSEALRFSYDKPRVKVALDTARVPTPRWRVFTSHQENGWTTFPAIVKPAQEHCSNGVTPEAVVGSLSELRARVAWVCEVFGQAALVEDFIDGREFHVPLWGDTTAEMLPPVEMDFSAFDDVHDRLCSYDAKFTPASRAYRGITSRVPARLTEAEMKALTETATAAYEAVGCRDYGRIDIRLRDGVFYVLDVNPNADISADASLALAASRAGYSYGDLGSRVLSFAAQRYAQNAAPHQ